MLQKLLQALQSNETLSIEQIAKQLSTTSQMVIVMLEHLEALGCIKRVENCTEACAQCPLGNICQTGKNKPVKVWQVKARDIRLIPLE
ncbi:MAG: FeoC-like transcriptional regulator [Anaerolineales bacterium]